VLVGGKKISEGEGAPTVRSLLAEGWSGREIRFWLLSVHYRKPVDFSAERLEEARRTLKRLDTCVATLRQLREGESYLELDQLLYDLKSGFVTAMDDDLNISAALAVIFKVVKQLNQLAHQGRMTVDQVPRVLEAFQAIDGVLRIFSFAPENIDPRAEALLRQRDAARKVKDWALADRLREELVFMGVDVHDGKSK
jgi:cysteinyl-tRNA synthetase